MKRFCCWVSFVSACFFSISGVLFHKGHLLVAFISLGLGLYFLTLSSLVGIALYRESKKGDAK